MSIPDGQATLSVHSSTVRSMVSNTGWIFIVVLEAESCALCLKGCFLILRSISTVCVGLIVMALRAPYASEAKYLPSE